MGHDPIRVGEAEVYSGDPETLVRREQRNQESNGGLTTDEMAHLHALGKENGELRRAECLNACWFLSLEDAQSKCDAWRSDYNE